MPGRSPANLVLFIQTSCYDQVLTRTPFHIMEVSNQTSGHLPLVSEGEHPYQQGPTGLPRRLPKVFSTITGVTTYAGTSQASLISNDSLMSFTGVELVGGSKRTARGRRYNFLFGRRCGILVCKGLIACGKGVERYTHNVDHIFVTFFPFFLTVSPLRSHIEYIARLYLFIEYHQHLIQSCSVLVHERVLT